jgi:predicted short-subunit dehydrogenase-like oxidoreductase (DUF2520 family)
LDYRILDCSKKYNAIIGTAHPYQTFFYPEISNFNNIGWGISSDKNIDIISDFIKSIGGNPVDISILPNDKKALYHCSAVVASNFLSSIITLSKNIAFDYGINPQDFLPGIINTTLENNINTISNPEVFPLTGPIARGDSEAIKMHINALKDKEYAMNAYIYFSLATLELALHYNFINEEKYITMRKELLNEIGNYS